MNRKPKQRPTLLNSYDRKVIERYNGIHTGFIESYIPRDETSGELKNRQKQ